MNLIAGSERSQIVLESLHVHRRVGSNVAAASGGKKELPLGGVDARKSEGHDGILKVQREAGESGHQRLKNEGKCAGDIILQPQVGKYGRDGATGVQGGVLG